MAVAWSAAGWTIDVHVCAIYSPDLYLPALAEQIRAAAQQALAALRAGPIDRIDVAIDDLQISEVTR